MTNVDINTIGNTAFSTTNRESLVIIKILSTFFSKKKKKRLRSLFALCRRSMRLVINRAQVAFYQMRAYQSIRYAVLGISINIPFTLSI